MDKNKIAQAGKYVDKAQKIVITTHKNPDGDAVGSSIGLALVLRKMGKEVSVIVPNRYPDFLHWLPGQELVSDFLADPKKARELIFDADLLFALDYNDLSRIGEVEHAMRKATAPIIMVDHHLNPSDFAEVMISDATQCATAQMVYFLIEEWDKTDLIDREVGENLYTGIMTDSGSFRFSSTTSQTHYVAAALLDKGVVPNHVHESIFDTNSIDRMHLLGFALNERMKVMEEYQTAYIYLSAEELAKYNFKPGDTEGFVNFALSITGIRFAAFFAEKDGIIKISFRSKGDVPANEFSSNHFNGGGHLNAAGGMSRKGLNETVREFVNLVPEFMKPHLK